MIFGLGAALGWGISDLLAAIVARRIGSAALAVGAQIVGLLGYAFLIVVTQPSLDVPRVDVVAMLGAGLAGGIAYLSLYRGLEIGPIALVSPIVSAFAAVTIVLAVAILHESLHGAVLAGAIVTLVGVVLASTDLRLLRAERTRGAGTAGVPFALLAMAGFGIAAFISGHLAKQFGWLVPIAISRASGAAMICAVIFTTRRDVLRGQPASGLLLAAVVGVTDIVGISMFALGAERGLISIVVAASASFTILPVVGGLVLFRERPVLNQGIGVLMVIGGLLLLGLSS